MRVSSILALLIVFRPCVSDEELERVLAADTVCFSATSFTVNYTFTAPFEGNIVGVEFEYLSGGVTCDYRSYAETHWGCLYSDYNLMVQLIQEGDGSGSFAARTVYPTTSSDLTSYSPRDCVCAFTRYTMADYNEYSPTLRLMDETNAYSVSTSDVFSLQYSEGCCGASTGDNGGTTCAAVYFLYQSIDETRDCDEFNIDGFLADCSADFPAEQEALVAVEARVSTLESDTATSDSLTETHAAVEAVTADLSAYETATNANLAATDANLAATDVTVGDVSIRVNSIEETLSGFSSARMAAAQFDTLPTNTGASLLFGDKDLLIVISLAVNTVLFMALLAVLCRNGKGYKAVGTFAQSDSEMAELQ